MSSPPDAPPVAVALLARGSTVSPETIDAVRAQVYEPVSIHVVGKDVGALPAVDHFNDLLEELDPSVTYVWVVASGAVPRPDALAALVDETDRAGAGVAGSKLLDARNPDRLVSVGVATDVFDVPYLGLDADDVDQGQYDVVRDIAACDGRSLLVRRDLAHGLGGVDRTMALQPAAIDLCQRARLRGARVVVVPSSEVLVADEPGPQWRQEAGRIRAMAKVYGLVTLAWAIPMRLLSGLLEAVVAPFLGRWTLFDFLRAWGWNLIRAAGTARARGAARANRSFDDAELFRYQIRGSATLLEMGRDVAGRLRSRLPEEFSVGRREDVRRPWLTIGAVVALMILIAVRAAWTSSLPDVGHSLPLPAVSGDALAAYAGGWNPAGLGSPDQLHPSIALFALVQRVLFDDPVLARGVLVIGAALLGAWGMARLSRVLGVESAAAALGGLVYVAGPVARALGETTQVSVMVGAAVVPWAILAVITLPTTWWGRVGRVAWAGWLTGIAGAAHPVLIAVPLLAAVAWSVVGGWRWHRLVMGTVASVVALGGLMPWVLRVGLDGWVDAGAVPFWEPSLVIVVAVALAVVGVLVAGDSQTVPIAGWSAVFIAVGAVLARGAELGVGSAVVLAGLVIANLGVAAGISAGLQAAADLEREVPLRRGAALAAMVGASVVLVSTVFVIAPGRAGLPDDRGAAIDLAAVSEVDPTATRVLVLGEAGGIPGDERSFDGAHYRVVPTSGATVLDARLAAPRAGDDALDAVLATLVEGKSRRIGADLAEFGIAWIVAVDDTPFLPLLDGQLDLIPLRGLPRPTFQVEAQALVARSTDGRAWFADGSGFGGLADPDSRVRLAVNADPRWEPGPWRQVGWANEVSAVDGTATFPPIQARRTMAWFSFGWLLVLPVVAYVGRRWSS
ncbi:MAG: hypothetical protein KJO84_04680 [Acidimicrobiia bacterium]|nr:hypothetical protein [Acidimicrobiia bacterium]